MATYETVLVEHNHNGRIATVTMNRPEIHNAMSTQLLLDLQAAFHELSAEKELVGVVLTGAGRSFSAGADISLMRAAASLSEEQNKQDALRMAGAFEALYHFPAPLVARVNGAALGGGLGLMAVCDIVIAVDTARLAFSEVKLGIAPAMISPYVIGKIGSSWARRLFVTGERFTPAQAHEIGLVHTVATAEDLDAAVAGVVQELLGGAPQAMRACKMLAQTVGEMDPVQARTFTAETIARLRVGAEGQEGLQAFLEKRKPAWAETTKETDA